VPVVPIIRAPDYDPEALVGPGWLPSSFGGPCPGLGAPRHRGATTSFASTLGSLSRPRRITVVHPSRPRWPVRSRVYRTCDTVPSMKTATLPPLRVEPELRKTMERLLAPGETLSTFVEESIRQTVERRLADAAFAKKALASRADGRATGTYHAAAEVLRDLRSQVKTARRRQARRK
jgi:hypothetical protein